MNQNRRLLISLLIGLLVGSQVLAAKWGLLIEIETYKYPGRLLLHTSRDTYWMQNTLQQQNFPATHVQILRDKQATAQGIREAFEKLLKQCSPGDKVVIHYGGHGTQVADEPGGDEIDHQDEALVPYDAPKDPKNPRDNGLIRDDEIGVFLDKLRKAVDPKGHVLILIDACHSGTMSRGQAVVRTDNFQSTVSISDNPDGQLKSGWFDLPPSSVRAAGSAGKLVMISAALSGSVASEVSDNQNMLVGPVCFYFSQEMSLIDEQTTYQSLFRQIRHKMRTSSSPQTPCYEGDTLARLLGGDLVVPTLITRVKLELQQRFRLPRGMFLGYTKGSEVQVKAIRGDGPAVSLPGRVVEATPFASIIELNSPLRVADSISLQTTLSRRAFDAVSARVTLAKLSRDQQKEVEAMLQDVPNIQLVADAADWLIRPDGKFIELCRAADGLVLERFSEETIGNLPGRLTAYAQANWLRELDLNNPAMKASMTLIPVQFATDNDNVLAHPAPEFRNGSCVLRTDQQALLTITNTGKLPFYFSIIDIQPDASVDVPIPNNKYPAASLKLMPGKSRSFPLRQITPPLGLETYKLVLTQTPVELSGLVQTRGRASVPAHPLAKLLSARFRGGAQPSLALDEAGMNDIQFWIDTPKP
jgi:metacaspase-1